MNIRKIRRVFSVIMVCIMLCSVISPEKLIDGTYINLVDAEVTDSEISGQNESLNISEEVTDENKEIESTQAITEEVVEGTTEYIEDSNTQAATEYIEDSNTQEAMEYNEDSNTRETTEELTGNVWNTESTDEAKPFDVADPAADQNNIYEVIDNADESGASGDSEIIGGKDIEEVIEEDSIISKFDGSSEVGSLIVSGFKVWYKGQPLKDGDKVAEGDELSLAFDWRINNNENGITKFATDLETLNIKITELTGDLYYEGEKIATYKIDKASDKFIIDLDPEAVEGMSNIGGGAILAGEVNISSDRSKPDGSGHKLGFRNYIKDVTYSNPGSVSFKKSAPGTSANPNPYEDGGKIYINYTINLNYQEIMKGIELKDTVDSNTELDESSFKIMSATADGEGNVTETDVTSSLAAYTTVSKEGFTFTPPDSLGKASETKYTITYRVGLKTGVEFTSLVSIKNNADLTYTNEKDDPVSMSQIVTTEVKKPTIKKTGAVLEDSNGHDVKKNYTYKITDNSSEGGYCYPVKYTLSVTPNDFQKMFENNSSASIKLTDTLEGNCNAIADEDWMFYDGSGPNYTPLSVAGGHDSTTPFFQGLRDYYNNSVSTADKLYYNGEALTDDVLLKYLTNAQHIFGVNDYNSSDPKKEYDIKISDFTYNTSTKKYEYEYVIFVPSTKQYSDTFTNNIKAQVFGVTFEGKTDTDIESPPSAILVKGPSDVAAVYNSDTKRSDYKVEMADGETRSYVDYSVALRMDTLRYSYEKDSNGNTVKKEIPDWSETVNSINHIKIVDKVNGVTSVQNSGQLTLSNASSGSGTILLDAAGIHDARLELYLQPGANTFNPALSDRSEVDAREKALLDYGNTYGWINDTEHADGYDRDKLLDLYYDYHNALVEYYNANPTYKGAILPEDLPNNCEFSISNGQITVDIPKTAISSLTFRKYEYNPTGELSTISGVNNPSYHVSSIQNLVSGSGDDVYHIVLRYRADTTDVIKENATLLNTADVYFDDDTDVNDDTFPPIYVNSSVKINEKNNKPSTDYLEISKHTGSVEFNDQTISYTEGRNIGWYLRVNLSHAIAGDGKHIVITDDLPDGLTFDGTDNGDCIPYVAINGRNFDECVLPNNYFTVSASGKHLTISFDYTTELYNLLTGSYNSVRTINFYFKTKVDDSAIVELLSTKKTQMSFKNRAYADYGNVTYKTDYVSKTYTLEKQIQKESMEKDYSTVRGKPIVDVENNTITGYYRINVNPYAADLVDGDILAVTDVMTEKMILDPSSVRAVDADTNSEVSIEHSAQEDNTVKFMVPDNRHLYIYYKVVFNVNPSREPDWMKVENTKNTCTISAYESTKNTGDEVDFSNFTSSISVWSYQMTGDISVFKYWNNNGSQTALPGATFKVYSVYDNNGNTYSDLSKDDVYQRYKDGLVSTKDGICEFTRLPLDRIYKLVETAAPDDCVFDSANEYYFILEGNFGVDIPAFLADKNIEIFHTGNIITYENKKIVEASGSKTWNDGNDKDGLRPASITVHLFADGKEIDKREVTAKDNWQWDFGKLPKNQEDGTEIVYSIKEDAVTGYSAHYDGFDIINTNKAEDKKTEETTTEEEKKTTSDSKTEENKTEMTTELRSTGTSAEITTTEAAAVTTEEATTETKKKKNNDSDTEDKKTGNSSKTGDDSGTKQAAVAAVVSLIGLVLLMYRKKRM